MAWILHRRFIFFLLRRRLCRAGSLSRERARVLVTLSGSVGMLAKAVRTAPRKRLNRSWRCLLTAHANPCAASSTDTGHWANWDPRPVCLSATIGAGGAYCRHTRGFSTVPKVSPLAMRREAEPRWHGLETGLAVLFSSRGGSAPRSGAIASSWASAVLGRRNLWNAPRSALCTWHSITTSCLANTADNQSE